MYSADYYNRNKEMRLRSAREYYQKNRDRLLLKAKERYHNTAKPPQAPRPPRISKPPKVKRVKPVVALDTPPVYVTVWERGGFLLDFS